MASGGEGRRSEEEERARKREDDEVVAWAMEEAREGRALEEETGLEEAELQGVLRTEEGRREAGNWGIIGPVRPGEAWQQGWARRRTTGTREEWVGEEPWKEDTVPEEYHVPSVGLASWTEEVERTGGSGWGDAIAERRFRVNR